MPSPPTRNLFSGLPMQSDREITEVLLAAGSVRLERIVSFGQASAAGFWYDQDEAEWVMLASGRARLTIEGESGDRELKAGDIVYLPARCRHRVAWTDPLQPVVWLALFLSPDLAAGG